MKQLLAGVVIIFVVGFGSFLYRNIMERPGVTVPEVACTMEAKLCPDGSAVGRTGPRCEFAPCAFPNVEVAEANASLAVPEGYQVAEAGNALLRLEKPSRSGVPLHTIVLYRYPVAEGESPDDVILRNTVYQPAGEPAEDFSRFKTLSIGGRDFREVTIERFEALVHTSYFLVREGEVLRFDITEHDVMAWMEPGLDIRTLPEHAALLRLLGTLQTP